jgi:intracellular multiplication protein IcmE
MNNKNDDPLMDEPDTLADFDDNGDFAEFDQQKSNSSFGALVKNNPLIKIGMVVAGLIVIVGLIMMFGGEKEKLADSSVPQGAGAELKEAPGLSEVSPEMRQALEDDNQQRMEEALQTGQSVLPTPIDPPKERLPVPTDTSAEEDPLLRWRQMQEERLQTEQQTLDAAQQTGGDPAQPPAPDPALGALTAAMQAQMGQVLGEDKTGSSIQYMEVTNLADLLAAMQAQQQGGAAQGQQAMDLQMIQAQLGPDEIIDPQTGQIIKAPKISIKAGSIEYAQMITEANSDIPGPVVAMLASGKYSGSRMLGSFERKDKLLVISFNTLVDKKGVAIPIEAYALDPGTTLGGLATEVDQRYWKRVILPAAADFVQGLGEAVAESGSSTVTVSGDTVIEEQNDIDTRQELYKGVERGAERVSELLDDEADKTEILVRVAAGTPMGVLFTQSVTDQDELVGKFNPKAAGGFRQNQQNNQSFQQQLLQSAGGSGGGANDTESLLQSLRDLQGQQSLQGANQ